MKIAVFCKKSTFHKGYGGMEVQNKLLCEGLVSRGHQITVFTPKNEVDVLEKTENGIRYIFIDCDYRYFMSGMNKNSWFNRSYETFKKLHSSEPFDIALSQSSAGIGIIERKKSLNIKVISISHGSTMGEFRTFYINHHSILDLPRLLINLQYSLRQFFGRQRQFVLHSDKVIAVSNAVKKQLEDETFPPANLITVVHNGIEPFDIALGAPKLSKKLIYIGQLTKDKGTELFLNILSDLRFKDFELDIIGDGEMMPAFQKATTEHNTVLKINLLGRLTSHEKVIEKLKSELGAVFVFPTKRVEGFPMVLVEAMFAGLPTVAYDLGGVSDAVTNNETGILVPFNKQQKFINSLLALTNDPVKMEYMSKNARNIAENNFSLDIMLNKYESVIKEVVK